MATKAEGSFPPLKPHSLDRLTMDLIRTKARRMARRSGLCDADRNDLEQDMMVKLLRVAAKYDPSRHTWPAFVTMVVHRLGLNFLRNLWERRRGASPSGDEGVPVESDEPLGGASDWSAQEWSDLEMDVQEAIESLPDDLKVIARELMRSTPTGAARKAGLPRTSFLRIVARIRRRFALRGLDAYRS